MQSSADIEKRSRKSGGTKRRDTKQRRDKRRISTEQEDKVGYFNSSMAQKCINIGM